MSLETLFILAVCAYIQNLFYMATNICQQNFEIINYLIRDVLILEDIFLENMLVYLLLESYEIYGRKERSIWMRNRYVGWWEEIVPQFSNDDWIHNFRMSKKTFNYICKKLEPALRPKPNPLMPRVPLSVEKQVAIAILIYATCSEYHIIGHVFGVHQSTVWKCIHRVTEAINEILLPLYICLPDEEECKEISKRFEEITGMPNLIGAVDGSHIPIVAPSDGYRDFINRKDYPSYVLQGLVDDQLIFRNINIESPGSNHDANVFKNSSLYKNYEELICQTKKVINGIEVPYLIMGDPAYPLLPWLMKGFVRTANRTAYEESFNAYMNSGRVKIEIAFGRLKSRWRRIAKRCDCHYTLVPKIVAACCTLHNILEIRKQKFHNKWLERRKNDTLLFPEADLEELGEEEDSHDGKVIRNVLLDIVKELPLRKTVF